MTFLAHDVSGGAWEHGYCLAWRPWLLWPSVISDALIAAAYFAVPWMLWRAARRGGDGGYFPARWISVLFCTFILSCGVTHVLGIVTIWWPVWWLSNASKAVTAVGSVSTAIALLIGVRRFQAWQDAAATLRAEQARFEAEHVGDRPADIGSLRAAVRGAQEAARGLGGGR